MVCLNPDFSYAPKPALDLNSRYPLWHQYILFAILIPKLIIERNDRRTKPKLREHLRDREVHKFSEVVYFD